jgi:hypothetical protein
VHLASIWCISKSNDAPIDKECLHGSKFCNKCKLYMLAWLLCNQQYIQKNPLKYLSKTDDSAKHIVVG